ADRGEDEPGQQDAGRLAEPGLHAAAAQTFPDPLVRDPRHHQQEEDEDPDRAVEDHSSLATSRRVIARTQIVDLTRVRPLIGVSDTATGIGQTGPLEVEAPVVVLVVRGLLRLRVRRLAHEVASSGAGGGAEAPVSKRALCFGTRPRMPLRSWRP